jgi:LEA14-like dessication related protein
MKRTIVAILLIMPLLGACNTVPGVQEPYVSVENIDLGSGNLLGQQMLLTLRLTNPNDFDIPLDGLRAQMDLNGQPFAQGVSNYRTTLPRLGSVVVPLEASISMMNLVRQVMSLGQAKSFDYVLSGDVFVVGQSFRNVPFEKTGNFTFGP